MRGSAWGPVWRIAQAQVGNRLSIANVHEIKSLDPKRVSSHLGVKHSDSSAVLLGLRWLIKSCCNVPYLSRRATCGACQVGDDVLVLSVNRDMGRVRRNSACTDPHRMQCSFWNGAWIPFLRLASQKMVHRDLQLGTETNRLICDF
jgi:hypothetical protein